MGGEEAGKPWYLKRRVPIFCNCCRAVYEAVFPGRGCTLCLGVFMWILGFLLILASILVCVARECSSVAGALCPLGIVLMWLGYALFHCGWAAHLLEDRAGPWSDAAAQEAALPPAYTDDGFAVTEGDAGKKAKKGYWQFADDAAWQAISSRDQLQYTMKPMNAP